MDNSGKNKNDSNKDKRNQNFMTMAVIAMVMMFVFSFFTRSMTSMDSDDLSYNEFLQIVQETDTGKIVSVEIDPAYNKITLIMKENGQEVAYETGIVGDIDDLSTMLLSRGIEIKGRILEESGIWVTILGTVLPFIIVFGIFSFMMKRGGGGIMGVGKSTAKMYMQKETGVTFKDVAGQDEAEESLVEIVDFLHNPGRYAAIGAKLPKGALLVGPPGTGKTLLAKAVAGEAKVPFFSLAGSDFVEMFVGVGASRVRDLFKQAQQNAPCIIFIDEIDAIGKSRDTRFGGNDEREQTLNQLLAEMDGFDSSKGVFILAATNRPEVLDQALLRPGRLDRRIIVDKPDLKGRVAILKVHSKNVRMDDTVDLDAIGMATAGAVGSDLANMINEAAILAVKNNRKAVSQADLFESVEVVIAGKEKKDRVMNDDEKKRVAYHEVGHALAAAMQKNTEPVQKITIVPRTMGSLGYTMQMPEEERFLQTQAELEADLVIFLAGRAAEQIFFESVSTGAANDIERATRIARTMVTRLGMSEEFGLMGLESVESMYLDNRSVYNCGEQTIAKVDAVVMRMLREAYEKALSIINSNKLAMERIAAFLIEKESITGKEFMKILGEVQEELRQLEQQAIERQQELLALESEEAKAETTAPENTEEAVVEDIPETVDDSSEDVVEISISEKTVTEDE